MACKLFARSRRYRDHHHDATLSFTNLTHCSLDGGAATNLLRERHLPSYTTLRQLAVTDVAVSMATLTELSKLTNLELLELKDLSFEHRDFECSWDPLTVYKLSKLQKIEIDDSANNIHEFIHWLLHSDRRKTLDLSLGNHGFRLE